jgi:hypothetical protein
MFSKVDPALSLKKYNLIQRGNFLIERMVAYDLAIWQSIFRRLLMLQVA